MHGGGSLKDNKELDEQWELQQEILRARRGGPAKEEPAAAPKKKQSLFGARPAAAPKQQQQPKRKPQVSVTQKQDDAMYVDDSKPAFKFPWDK